MQREPAAGEPAALVLVGHGSRNPAAGRTLRKLRDAVAKRLPGRLVQLAWLELGSPLLTDVLAAHRDRAAAAPVVVPLLLSRGTHHSRDLPPQATAPLGPDPLLTEILLDRVRTAQIPTDTPLLLAASGSQDPVGIADVQAQADLLETAWQAPVGAGFVTTTPRLAEVRQEMESAFGRRPAIVSYFLAPGRLPSSARPDTAHLGTHPALVDLVLARYHGAVTNQAVTDQAVGSNADRHADWSGRTPAYASAQTFAEPPFAPDGVTRMGL